MRSIHTFTLCSLLILFSLKGEAQIDRSEAPKPGPPPEIKLGDPYSFTLDNGLKVFVVEERTTPMLSFYLQLDHDPVLEGAKTGYVGMTGSMLDKGTKDMSRQEIARKVDGMGASLNTGGKYIYAESLREHSGDLLTVMADVLLNPTFPKEQLGKLKRNKKSAIQQEQANSRAILRNVSKAVTFGKDHPYGEVETKESIDSVKVKDLEEHYKNYWKAGNAYLAVVGDVDPKKAEEMVRSHFSDWEKGKAPTHDHEDPGSPSKNKVAVANKDGSTQATLAFSHPVQLKPGDEDVLSVKLMNSVLGGGGFSSRLFNNLREDKGYTYGVYSGIGTDPIAGRFFAGGNVAQSKTDSSIIQIRKEIEKLKNEGVTEKELETHKQIKNGAFTRQLEDPQTIAQYAINIERYDLPKDHYKNYLKRLDKVSKEEVDRAAKDYLKPDRSHIVVVGDEDSLKGQLKHFGPVQRYDTYGFKRAEKKDVGLSKDLTAKKVLKDFEEALGGKKAISKIEDVKRVYNGKIRGQKIEMTRLYEREEPGFFGSLFGKEAKVRSLVAMKMPARNRTLQKQVYDGTNAYTKGPRGKVDTLTGEDLKSQKRNAILYPQRKYLENGYEVKVLKGEQVQGEKAVILKVTAPSGESRKEFYSLESGLLLKKVSEQETQQGTMETTTSYMDYEEFSGVKFPNKIKIDSRFTIEFSREEIMINQGIDNAKFSL